MLCFMAQVTHSLPLADTYPKRRWITGFGIVCIWHHPFGRTFLTLTYHCRCYAAIPAVLTRSCNRISQRPSFRPSASISSTAANLFWKWLPWARPTMHLMFYCYWARAVTAMQGRAQNAQEQHNLLEAPQKAINFLRHDSTAIIKYMWTHFLNETKTPYI